MLDHIEDGNRSERMAVIFAFASSVFFGLVLWIWEPDLLWMLAVLLPPIWSPVIYRRFGPDHSETVDRVALAAVMLGLTALLGVGVLIYLIR